MRTIQILIILPLFILIHFQLKAQKTTYFEDVQKEISMGKELFEQGKYNAVFRQFEKIQAQVSEKSEVYSEAEYFKSVSALKAGHASGSKMMDKFIGNYPESPYINGAWFNLGTHQFDKRQYAVALRSFGHIDREIGRASCRERV